MSHQRVFISWSKPRSKAVAAALYDWLPTVLQNVETWMSAADIDKGSKWRQVLSGELATANFGIICLTPENLKEPWILFEAGALSKATESRVWTYLYNLDFASIKDPLSEFNHTVASKEETRRLVGSINTTTSEPVPPERLSKLFDALWPELERALLAIPAVRENEETTPSPKADEDIMREILLRVREIEKNSRIRRHPSPQEPSKQSGLGRPTIPALFAQMESIEASLDFSRDEVKYRVSRVLNLAREYWDIAKRLEQHSEDETEVHRFVGLCNDGIQEASRLLKELDTPF